MPSSAKPAPSKMPPAPQPDEYKLRSPFIGNRFTHPLSQTEFAELCRARTFLTDYVRFEESVLQVLYSWEEFEAFLLNTALNQYVFPLYEHDFAQDTRLRSNLKVLGFLNSITSLRDQFPKFKSLLPALDQHKLFKELWNKQKDTSVAFSFCERFRNYAQHQTQPVSSVTTGGGWNETTGLLESHVSIFVDVGAVCANRDIKRDERVRYETEFGAECDVGLLFRETAAGIGQIVQSVRANLEQTFAKAIATYESNLSRVPITDNLQIAEVAHLSAGAAVETFSIFKGFSERAKGLHRTFLMTNNQRHFVSNKARGHKKSNKRGP